MEYICTKSLSLAGIRYHPGDIIPDGIVLNGRVGKLESSGYITGIGTSAEALGEDNGISRETETVYMQECVAELQDVPPEIYAGTFMIPVKTEDDEGGNAEYISLPMTPEGVKQVVSVIQSKANEGIEMISGITDENVLILIHALDSRVKVKNAAKKQAGTLTSAETVKDDAGDDNESSEPSAADDNNKTEDGVVPQDGEGK